MNKMPKEKRDMMILVILMAVAAIGVLYQFVLGDQIFGLLELQSRGLSLESKIYKNKSEYLNKRDKRLEDLRKAQGELATYEKDMLTSRDNAKYELQKRCNELALELGFDDTFVQDVTRASPEWPGVLPKMDYEGALMTVTLSGYYDQVGKFAAAFENKFPYMRLQQLQFRPEGKDLDHRKAAEKQRQPIN